MELTDSFLTLLQNFAPVFTAPTYQTFVVIVTGWIISQRHRDVTDLLQWLCRRRTLVAVSSLLQPRRLGHRQLLLRLAKLVVTIFAPGATFFWAVYDTLCRKRGLTLDGAGHALRPADLQSRQIPGQLGTPLGCADLDRRLPRLGTVQSFRLAHRHGLVPQPPRADQGEKESEGEKRPEEIHQTQARPESSHPTWI